ncbi:hypothetical protein SLEP1_g27870 [Rubroshorea leprosula]|uniref:DUF4220 domain-containing protein n=1 Tax=Rubroshorea leprosula TaxID=152421 RepID=A0AAV5K382_9ROSI|nr:hypothetical protein SLEP1_g27870 [Rubroshorea leprosula]
MVLFSLLLQIVLYILGSRRKHRLKRFFKTILWFAYLGADWIALATLGKLSSSHTETPTTNVLRGYWAPLLLLHLGGPDTITAYAFEDNKLWIRHLLILIVKAIFVVYVVCLSWTFSWLSFLGFPLILAGIIKYVEKILCLKLNNSQKTKSVISDSFNPRGHPHSNFNQTLDHLLKDDPTVMLGYLLFTIMRPDVNDYLSFHRVSSALTRLQTRVKNTTNIDDPLVLFEKFDYIFEFTQPQRWDIFVVELEFIFDVVYTKAALIYTKLGCFLRLTSFVSSFSVLLLFFISIINEPKFQFSRVDLAITGILLTGAIALELYAAWLMLSSDWAILVAAFHHNMLVRKMFWAALKGFRWLLHRRKRWSNHLGQFDLLKYCWRYKKKQDIRNFMKPITSFIMSKSQWPSRGKRALEDNKEYDNLVWSIELEFDYSIIIWHLATSVCYLQEDHDNDEASVCYLQGDHDDDEASVCFSEEDQHKNKARETSKLVSDYMMYLLAMCPAMILPDHSKNFWLDETCDELKEHLFSATDDITNAASTLLSNLDNVRDEEELESSQLAVENLQGDEFKPSEMTFKHLQKDVSNLVTSLKKSENKWMMIRDVWTEMLVYAAISNRHISHVRLLGEGIEFLSLIWLFASLNFIFYTLVTFV